MTQATRGRRHLATGIGLVLRRAAALLICVTWSPSLIFGAELSAGAGRREVWHDGRTIPVWYYLPQDAGPDAPVLFVMHGVNRDADRYRDEWLPHAKKYGFVLLVPEFSKEAFPDEAYSFGNVLDEQ